MSTKRSKKIPNILPLIHKLGPKTFRRLASAEQKELRKTFKDACTKTKKIIESIPETKRELCTMESFNNVWWALSEIPAQCISWLLATWLPLVPYGVQSLSQTILKLPPSSSKRRKLEIVGQYLQLTAEDQPLAYTARSNDVKLLDKFVQKLYQNSWRNIPDAVLADMLFEAIRNIRFKMVTHILNKTKTLEVNWRVLQHNDNPYAAFQDFEQERFLRNTRVADLVRKRLGIAKQDIDLIYLHDLEAIHYVLDDPSPHPQL